MAEIVPDFSEVAKIIPGIYTARILGTELGEWKTGTKFVKFDLSILGKDGAPDATLVHRTPFTGRGAGFFEDMCVAALGEVPAAGAGFNTDTFQGREFLITLKDGVDQNGNPSKWPDVAAVNKLA